MRFALCAANRLTYSPRMIGRSAAAAGRTLGAVEGAAVAALESPWTAPADVVAVTESAVGRAVPVRPAVAESATFASLDEHASRATANSGEQRIEVVAEEDVERET